VGRAKMLAYVEQPRLVRSRRHRAEELAFWLSLGPAVADHWLRGRRAQTLDCGRWLSVRGS
jgi:hypothetical protein